MRKVTKSYCKRNYSCNIMDKIMCFDNFFFNRSKETKAHLEAKVIQKESGYKCSFPAPDTLYLCDLE